MQEQECEQDRMFMNFIVVGLLTGLVIVILAVKSYTSSGVYTLGIML